MSISYMWFSMTSKSRKVHRTIEEQLAGLLNLIKDGLNILVLSAGIGLIVAIFVIVYVVRKIKGDRKKEGRYK